ncbi:AI-2E family transporter [Amnimonas aquatica]|nr:AI-2E family transporter [Amnimonas aquatica]
MKQERRMKERNRWLLLIGLALLAWLVYALRPILMPFLVGALFAYLGNPLVQRLMRFGWSRLTAVSVTFTALCTAGAAVLVILLPRLWEQLMYLESRIPSVLRWMNRHGIPWLEQKLRVNIDRLDMDLISNWLTSVWQSADAGTANMLTQLAQSGLHLAATLGLIALIPVVTFYLMLDWDHLLARTRELLPRRSESRLVSLAQECDGVLAAFLRGQLMVMFALGLIYGLGLQLIGLKLAMVIGLVAGLASIIPYFGFALGIVIATIVALFQFGLEWQPVLMVWVVFGIGQLIEGWVLQPWLIGDRIGLPPVGVIFAVMAGGQLFGIFGMLLALPVAAIIVVLVRHAHAGYLRSHWYQGGGPPSAA